VSSPNQLDPYIVIHSGWDKTAVTETRGYWQQAVARSEGDRGFVVLAWREEERCIASVGRWEQARSEALHKLYKTWSRDGFMPLQAKWKASILFSVDPSWDCWKNLAPKRTGLLIENIHSTSFWTSWEECYGLICHCIEYLLPAIPIIARFVERPAETSTLYWGEPGQRIELVWGLVRQLTNYRATMDTWSGNHSNLNFMQNKNWIRPGYVPLF